LKKLQGITELGDAREESFYSALETLLDDYAEFLDDQKDFYPLFQVLTFDNILQISRLNATSGEKIATTYLNLGTTLERYYNFDVAICKEEYFGSNNTFDWINAEIIVAHLVNENNSYFDSEISDPNYQIALFRINITPFETKILKSTNLVYNHIYSLTLSETNIDFDNDGFEDYLIKCRANNNFDLISGIGRDLYSRYFFKNNILEAGTYIHQGIYYNFYKTKLNFIYWSFSLKYYPTLNNFQVFFRDPGDLANYRISALQVEPDHLVYYEDINTYGGKQSFYDFFSFGTNDLTQTTFGFSRDDAGTFIPAYIEKKILIEDPFASLDTVGTGQLIEISVKKGRKVKPKLKLGICGEHGGDPASIEFCHKTGLNYVSCSPFRVPVARLAAAQAVLKNKKGK